MVQAAAALREEDEELEGDGTEKELISRAQKHDEEALEAIYRSYYPRIYNYGLLNLGNVQAAEDLASEVMLRVIESIDRYRFRGIAFSAWVFRIARNRVIDLKRRQSRHKEVDVPETLVAPHANTHQQAELALNRDHLRDAMSYLTEEQRQVMLLRFIEGFDNASVSRIVGRSESAVKSLQHRALNSMRRKLNGENGRRGRKKKAAV